MKPTIELSMIVKDGAPVLGRCLASVAPLVDRMVVGDTGSRDESREIARKFGAEVIDVPWEQDFARARNQVLKHRKCDWILVLDADEMLDPGAVGQIGALLETPEIYAYHNWRWNYLRDTSMRIGYQAARPNPVRLEASRAYPAYVPLPTTRLFRNHEGIYYEGCVHETVTRRLAALKLGSAKADFLVHHFGHAEDSSTERVMKNALYQVLAAKKIESNPNDAQAWMEQGQAELEHAHRPDKALACFEKACALSPRSGAAWLYAGMCLVRLERIPEALERLDRAARLGMQNAVWYQAVGDAHFHAGRFEDARKAYVHLKPLGESSPLSEAKLGACEVHLGMKEDGLTRMRSAVAGAPAFAELYDILAAGALLAGDIILAAQTTIARIQMGNATDFHLQLATALDKQLTAMRAAQVERSALAS